MRELPALVKLASSAQARCDLCLGRRELGRQVIRELLEQLIMQRELGLPGRRVDARDLLEVSPRQIEAFPSLAVVARETAVYVRVVVRRCFGVLASPTPPPLCRAVA